MDSFQIDEDALVPLAIEISPISPSVSPLVQNSKYMMQYKEKLKQIGKNHWIFEQLYQQLSGFKDKISPHFEDLEMARFINELYTKVSVTMDDMRKKQEEGASFLQLKTVDEIAGYLYFYKSYSIFQDCAASQCRVNITESKICKFFDGENCDTN